MDLKELKALLRLMESSDVEELEVEEGGRRVRIRYMTQPKRRPPTFALFGNQLKALPEAYLRYLANSLRETFHLEGAPIRFLLRTAKNPHADK